MWNSNTIYNTMNWNSSPGEEGGQTVCCLGCVSFLKYQEVNVQWLVKASKTTFINNVFFCKAQIWTDC